MRRREFITLLGGAAAGCPLAARAQPTNKIARIGFLGSATAVSSSQSVRALREGLNDLGYVEGKNITMEFRWAEGKYERQQEIPAVYTVREYPEAGGLMSYGTSLKEVYQQSVPMPVASLRARSRLICR